MSHMGWRPFGGAVIPTISGAAQSLFPGGKGPVAGWRQMGFDSAGFTATVRAMSRLLLTALLALTLAACARGKPKSTAHMYEGNAPTIKFSDKPENAGGRLNTY